MDEAQIKRRVIPVMHREVHLLTAGRGTPLLLVHGSPNSSDALRPLIAFLAQEFFVIAPDTPGNGGSTPLPDDASTLGDYADALRDLLDALGLSQVGAYGYHSGASTVAELGRRYPHRLSALVCDGLPIWSERELREFEEGFFQSYAPVHDGSHLMRLWSRLIDQNWYFPWHRGAKGRQVRFDLNDTARLHDRAMELLIAGDAHMAPYRAVLESNSAERLHALTVPTLVMCHNDDVIAKHFHRLPNAPMVRRSRFKSRKHMRFRVRDWFAEHAREAALPPTTRMFEQGQNRFVDLRYGQVFVRGGSDPGAMWLHDVGESSRTAPATRVSFDLPGHGLTDIECPHDPYDLVRLIEDVFEALHADPSAPGILGAGLGYQLANMLSGTQSELRSTPCQVPEIDPRWDGGHLAAAWHYCRFRSQYRRWDNRIPQGRLNHPLPSPEDLHLQMIDLLRAGEHTLQRLLPFSVADLT